LLLLLLPQRGKLLMNAVAHAYDCTTERSRCFDRPEGK
jgi:hypothetical protein